MFDLKIEEVVDSSDFKTKKKTEVIIGKDNQGKFVKLDLARHNKVYIAGMSGSGRANTLISIVSQLIISNKEEDLELCLIDAEVVEFGGLGNSNLLYQNKIFYKKNEILNLSNNLLQLAKLRKEQLQINPKSKFKQLVIVVAECMIEPREIFDNFVKLLEYCDESNISVVFCTHKIIENELFEIIRKNFNTKIIFKLADKSHTQLILGNDSALKCYENDVCYGQFYFNSNEKFMEIESIFTTESFMANLEEKLFMENNHLKYLKNSLIYQMSLGSKELFHSNVWAWLIEQNSEFLKVFFKNFDENIYKIEKVDREIKHRDIIIWLTNKQTNEKCYLVIENKIKSIPTVTQLKDYTEDLWNNKLVGSVLTGLENTFKEDNLIIENNGVVCNWQFVSYKEIAEGILNIAECGFRGDVLNQIREYCRVIESINELIKFAKNSTENRLCYDLPAVALKEIRLNDVFVKHKGSEFYNYVLDNLKIQKEGKGFKFETNQSFHNGKSTLDFRFTKYNENDRNSLMMGIQIEGYQYRICAQRWNDKYKAKLYRDMVKVGLFDDNYDVENNRSVFNRTTSMKSKDKFDKYEMNDSLFIYQYFNVENWSYRGLLNQLEDDLNKIVKIINKNF